MWRSSKTKLSHGLEPALKNTGSEADFDELSRVASATRNRFRRSKTVRTRENPCAWRCLGSDGVDHCRVRTHLGNVARNREATMRLRLLRKSAETAAGSTAGSERVDSLFWLGCATLLAAVYYCGHLGFYSIFTGFSPYDDEGTALMTLANLDKGRPLYDQVASTYGPVGHLLKLC